MPRREWLLVSEEFLSAQGEGPSVGVPASFLRLGACNLHCKWCDTPYTWVFSEAKAKQHESVSPFDPSLELKRVPLIKLADRIISFGTPLCVITGGEPLLQLEAVSSLISLVNENPAAPRFEIETAGTLQPYELSLYDRVNFNVSPKLAGSGNPKEKRFVPAVLKEFAELAARGRASFKFVIDTRDGGVAKYYEDLEEVGDIVTQCGIPNDSIYLMPCGTTTEELLIGLQLLAPVAIDRRWNLTNRLQIMCFGDKRGT